MGPCSLHYIEFIFRLFSPRSTITSPPLPNYQFPYLLSSIIYMIHIHISDASPRSPLVWGSGVQQQEVGVKSWGWSQAELCSNLDSSTFDDLTLASLSFSFCEGSGASALPRSSYRCFKADPLSLGKLSLGTLGPTGGVSQLVQSAALGGRRCPRRTPHRRHHVMGVFRAPGKHFNFF